MITTNNILNYKETLIRSIKRGEAHVYYFEYRNNPTIKGFYALEDGGKTYISICAISQILKESVYEKLYSKYFDIDKKLQKQCFLIEKDKIDNFDELDQNLKAVIGIISQNHKKGTPRKHITVDGERINIQLKIKTISDDYFEDY